MNADHIISALNARWVSNDRFVFACPIHKSRSHSSGRGLVLNDRVVIKDFGGCRTEDILMAAGLTWSDLFEDQQRKNSVRNSCSIRAAEGLDQWRQSELQNIAEHLRARDTVAGALTRMVQAGEISEEQSYDSLAWCYDGYAHLEYLFNRLLRNEGVLQLWREWRAA